MRKAVLPPHHLNVVSADPVADGTRRFALPILVLLLAQTIRYTPFHGPCVSKAEKPGSSPHRLLKHPLIVVERLRLVDDDATKVWV